VSIIVCVYTCYREAKRLQILAEEDASVASVASVGSAGSRASWRSRASHASRASKDDVDTDAETHETHGAHGAEERSGAEAGGTEGDGDGDGDGGVDEESRVVGAGGAGGAGADGTEGMNLHSPYENLLPPIKREQPYREASAHAAHASASLSPGMYHNNRHNYTD
jgi:hypothetical protein